MYGASIYVFALVIVLTLSEVCSAVAQTMQPQSSSSLWSITVYIISTVGSAVIGGFIVTFFDKKKTINQELIRKRISIYDSLVPKLNDVLCFFLIVGGWKELDPTKIIKKKRELDHLMYVYGSLFSPDVMLEYNKFIHLCFKTFTGVGRDACLRADLRKLQRNWGNDWNSEWDKHFVEAKEVSNNKDVRNVYNNLIMIIAKEIGVVQKKTLMDTLKDFCRDKYDFLRSRRI